MLESNKRDKTFFSSIKEGRDWYFVDYDPPQESTPFATLALTVIRPADKETIARAMENELRSWLVRYPIPIMVSAFDDTGSVINLEDVRTWSHLIGFFKKDTTDVALHWKLLQYEEIPNDALNRDYVKKLYKDVPFRTSNDIQREINQQRKQIRLGWIIVFVWAVVIPVTIEILGFANEWIGVVVLIYSLVKAAIKALKLMGKWKKSPTETAEEEEERLMRHHHYHCKLNPEGFQRLRTENFDRETRERTRKEAKVLMKR